MSAHAYPEVVVDTDWVTHHGGDPEVVVVEVDVDTALYLVGRSGKRLVTRQQHGRRVNLMWRG